MLQFAGAEIVRGAIFGKNSSTTVDDQKLGSNIIFIGANYFHFKRYTELERSINESNAYLLHSLSCFYTGNDL